MHWRTYERLCREHDALSDRALSAFCGSCRHCYRLAYPSQREKPGDRAARKADRIRDKLGWEAGILNGAEPWNKPKGMHQATFDRLRWKHDHFVSLALAGFAEQFGFDLEDKHRF